MKNLIIFILVEFLVYFGLKSYYPNLFDFNDTMLGFNILFAVFALYLGYGAWKTYYLIIKGEKDKSKFSFYGILMEIITGKWRDRKREKQRKIFYEEFSKLSEAERELYFKDFPVLKKIMEENKSK